MSTHFQNLSTLSTTLKTEKHHLVITYLNMPEYDGMALYLGLHYIPKTEKFQLHLEYMCLGLDVYGDTLQESYIYEFNDLQAVLTYLEKKYTIKLTDIPIKFDFDSDKFPSPIYHGHLADIFREAWERFLVDFRNNKFLDSELSLIYNSLNRNL